MVKNTPAIFWQKALKFETVVIVIKYAILSKSANIYVLLLLLLRYSNVFFLQKNVIYDDKHARVFVLTPTEKYLCWLSTN